MKKLLFLLAAVLLLSACAQVRFVSWDLKRIEIPGDKEKALEMATGSMNNAVQSREYLLLYNAVHTTGIPANIMAKLNKNDRIAVIAAERDTLEYVDYMHLFVGALSRNLVNAGYQVVDLRPTGRRFGLEHERLLRSVDKLLVFTIWEAGSRSMIIDDKASVFSAFQINLDVVEAKTNLLLASQPVFGSTRNDFDKREFDRFQLFTLTEVNAALPLIYADDSKQGVIGLTDTTQGREFVLSVYNPMRETLHMAITDLAGNVLLEREISYTEEASSGYYAYTWDGKLADGSAIQPGVYMLYLKDSGRMSVGMKRFTVN